MLIKCLGMFDLIAGVILLLDLHIFWRLFFVLGMILILKSSLGMLKDFASWIDFLSGLVLLGSIFLKIAPVIKIILGIAIIQKGLFSLI